MRPVEPGAECQTKVQHEKRGRGESWEHDELLGMQEAVIGQCLQLHAERAVDWWPSTLGEPKNAFEQRC